MPEFDKTDTQRLDRWLWQARFFKTRSLSTRVVRARKVRIDGNIAGKASTEVRVGQVLTFPQGNRIRVVRILALAGRRGPAAEARTLYEDMSPPPPKKADRPTAQAVRPKGAGRPTKAERRAIDRLRNRRD